MSYWRCFYHVVFSTKDRLPAIDEARESSFGKLTTDACRDLDVFIHGIGGTEDHLHLVLSIPPRHSVSDVVQRIKGTTSKAFGQEVNKATWPGWQGEYGVLTFGERSLDQVREYVANQKSHHASGTIISAYEQIDRRATPD